MPTRTIGPDSKRTELYKGPMSTQTTRSNEAQDTKTLYLVLQGEFAVYGSQEENCLHILAPDLEDHVYLAGPWLGEATIPKNTSLQLTPNVCSGNAVTKCLLTSVGVGTEDPRGARFHLTTPWPSKFISGVQEQTFPGEVIDAANNCTPILQQSFTSLILLLEYQYNGENPALISNNVAWGPSTWPAGFRSGYGAIHLYATADSREAEEDEGHSRRAFREASSLLGANADVRSNDLKCNGTRQVKYAEPPPGLTRQQVNLLLWQRLKWTQRLGEAMNGQAQFEGPWAEPRTTSGNSHNCGPTSHGQI